MTQDPYQVLGVSPDASEEEIKTLAHKCTFLGKRTIGNLVVMREPEIEAVYRMANHQERIGDFHVRE